jgi:hypothetical protein
MREQEPQLLRERGTRALWKQGYSAVMVTDTAPLRYRHYHRGSDTFERVNYDTLAQVVTGRVTLVGRLVATPSARR